MLVWRVLMIAVVGGLVFASPVWPQTKDGESQADYFQVPILIYHHVENLPANASQARQRWTITPERFRRHLQWLKDHNFNPITLKQLVEAKNNHRPLPMRPIVLTFDDGWRDHFTNVLTLLEEFGYKATFFIIAQSVGNSAYMNWDQLHALLRRGMDIQSHSLSHPKLTAIPLKKAQREIVDSKRILEEQLGIPITIFAYPFGYYDDRIIAVLINAGYEAGVTVSGINAGYLTRQDRSYSMIRYAVEGREELETIARLKKFYP